MEIHYTNPPIFEAVERKPSKMKLSEEFHFYVATNRFDFFTIPKGFEFDGASIPRFFWRVIGHPMRGDVIMASLIHDYFYRTGIIPRKLADKIFYHTMLQRGAPFIKARICYTAVRIFGRSSYHKCTSSS